MKEPGRNISLHKILFVILVVCLILLFIAACQSPPPPNPVSAVCNPVPVTPDPLPALVESITYQGPEIYGPVHSLHVKGSTVYLGLGDSFAVMDASNAAEPRLVGLVELHPYSILGFIIDSIWDNFAHLYLQLKPMGTSDDYVIDFSSPTNPTIVLCDPPILIPNGDIFAKRYEISSRTGFSISISEWTEEGSETQEISNFTKYSPSRIAWRQPVGQPIPLPYKIGSAPLKVEDFTFDERYLYVINFSITSYSCCQLSILDLENPANPEIVNTINLGVGSIPKSIVVAGDFLLVSDITSQMTNIYDISDKKNIIELISVSSSKPPQVHNNFAYFPSRSDSEIVIWDLQGSGGPNVVGKIYGRSDGIIYSFTNYLAFVGNYIYMPNKDKLDILDNHDPTNPTFIDSIQFPLLTSPSQIAVTDNQLAGKFSLVEVSTLTIGETGQMGDWQPLLTTDNDGLVYDLTIVDDYLYTIYHSDGLTSTEALSTMLNVYDIKHSISDSPTASLSIQDFGGKFIASTSTHLFLLNGKVDSLAVNMPSIQIVDISSPTNLTVVGEILLEPGGSYTSLAIWEDALYLASESPEQGISQFNVSNPKQPFFVGFYPFNSLTSLTAGDGYLFGLDDNQIEIFDIGSSTAPVLLNSFRLYTDYLYELDDLGYKDNILYVALNNRGVAAVRLNFESLE